MFLRRNKTILPSLCLLYVTEMWKLYLFSLKGASTFFLTDQLMILRVTFSLKFSLRSLRTKCCEIIYPLFLREFIAKTSRLTALGIKNVKPQESKALRAICIVLSMLDSPIFCFWVVNDVKNLYKFPKQKNNTIKTIKYRGLNK